MTQDLVLIYRLYERPKHWEQAENEKQSACESLLPSRLLPDVQSLPVIGGVNWQIQYKSRACSPSSSPS